MTDPGTLNCEASANVIALVNARHHGYHEAETALIDSMSSAELILTLKATVDSLTDRLEFDAREMGLTFEDYIRPLGEAVGRRRDA